MLKIIIIVFADNGLTKLSIKTLVKYCVCPPRESSASQLCLLSAENLICLMRAVRTMTTSVRSLPKKYNSYDVWCAVRSV